MESRVTTRAQAQTKANGENWHRRLGHCGKHRMLQLIKATGGRVPYTAKDLEEQHEDCEDCLIGKFRRLTRGKSPSYHEPLTVFCVDLTGPISPPTWDGKRYTMGIYEMGSGAGWVDFLEKKLEVLPAFKGTMAIIQTLKKTTGRTIIRIDGGEADSSPFKEYCRNQGYQIQMTTPYCSYQNGGVERYFQTLFSLARANMHQCSCPWRLWSEAVRYVNALHNNLPSIRDATRTPNQIIGYDELEATDFHVFGSVAYVAIQPGQRKSGTKHLGPRAVKMYYMGPDNKAKGNRFYDNVKDRIVVSAHARFTEQLQTIDRASDYYEDSEPVPVTLENIRRSIEEEKMWCAHTNLLRELEEEPLWEPENEEDDDEELWESGKTFVTLRGDEPTYRQAMESVEAQEWKQAMQEEYESLKSMETFIELKREDLPTGSKVVTSKWVLKRKRDENGKVVRYKARLVARGFSQVKGDSYDETFAPTTGLTTTRLILILAQLLEVITFHFDVKTAYLYGEVEHDIYMAPPKGIDGTDGTLWKLLKSIYGLKQAGFVWNRLLDELLCKYGFERSECEPCLYVLYKGNNFIIMNIHVDDMGGITTDKEMVKDLEFYLSKHVEIKHLGELRHFNGIKIERNQECIALSQLPNIMELLESNRMERCNPKATPMEQNLKLKIAEAEEIVNQSWYRTNIGKSLYIARCTRPDITTAVSILSRYSTGPGKEHHDAVNRLLGYLQGTKTLKLIFSGTIGEGLELKIFVDSDWAGCVVDRKSTTGYTIFLNGNLLSFRTLKQKITALSSCEAEYIAFSTAIQELIWILQLLKHMRMKCKTPIVYVDNQGAIDLVRKATVGDKSKHIDIRYHFARQLLRDGVFELQHIAGTENPADLFTKALNKTLFRKHQSALGLGEMEFKSRDA